MRYPLWSYPDDTRESFFSRIYDHINQHYGYTGAEWIDYLSDHDIQTHIKEEYQRCLTQQGARGIELKGTDHLIALIEAVTPFVEVFLDVEIGGIWDNIKDHLTLTVAQQQKQIDRQVKSSVDKFVEALNGFISSYPQAFDGVGEPGFAMTKVYGKVLDSPEGEDGNTWRTVYLRPEGLRDLCNLYGFDRNGLLVQLKESGHFKPWPVTSKDKQGNSCVKEREYKSMRIRKTGGDVYRFIIPGSKDYDDDDLVDQKKEEKAK